MCVAGYEVTTMEDAAKRASIFVTATGCCDVLRPEHFVEMRDDSILANIGHFDIEVDVAWLETNCKKVTIKPQVRLPLSVTLVSWLVSGCLYNNAPPPSRSRRLIAMSFPMAVT